MSLKNDSTIHVRRELRDKLCELAENRGISLRQATEDILRSALKMPPDESYKREPGGLIVARVIPDEEASE